MQKAIFKLCYFICEYIDTHPNSFNAAQLTLSPSHVIARTYNPVSAINIKADSINSFNIKGVQYLKKYAIGHFHFPFRLTNIKTKASLAVFSLFSKFISLP